MQDSIIGWTDDTQNFWIGCFRVSCGCSKCYMYRIETRWGRDGSVVRRTNKATFEAPLRKAKPSRIFTCSMSDFFIEQADDWRDDAWSVIRRTPQHLYQILTKRPENIAERLPYDWQAGYDNVMLGVSVENNNPRVLARMDILRAIPAKYRFLSIEPLLERLEPLNLTGIDWVIIGGESGNENGKFGYRPCELEWISAIIQQCREQGVPVFVKQLGTYQYHQLNLTHRHGTDIENWPLDIRVQEFPDIVPGSDRYNA